MNEKKDLLLTDEEIKQELAKHHRKGEPAWPDNVYPRDRIIAKAQLDAMLSSLASLTPEDVREKIISILLETGAFSTNEAERLTNSVLSLVNTHFAASHLAEVEKAKKEGYEEATKRAIEMAVFNIPYVQHFQDTPARLIGIVIPEGQSLKQG